MKIIDIVVAICFLLSSILCIVYLFFEIVFSFGIMELAFDIRDEILITISVLIIILFSLLIIERIIQKK